jgi:hypothetical protein
MGVAGILATGQTGAARGALDVAISLELERGGWYPRSPGQHHQGRPEDGSIPERYAFLRPYTADSFRECHGKCILEADASVYFCFVRHQRGGLHDSVLDLVRDSGKPWVLVDMSFGPEVARRRLARWLYQIELATERYKRMARYKAMTLHVVGPRESRAPGIAEDVRVVLAGAISDSVSGMGNKTDSDWEPAGGAAKNQYRHKTTGQLGYRRVKGRGGLKSPVIPYKCAGRGCKNPVLQRVRVGWDWKNGCAEHPIPVQVTVPDGDELAAAG